MSNLKLWIRDLGARSLLRQTEVMRHLTDLRYEAVPHLRLALERSGPIARLAAVQVLERIGDPGATPLLVNCLADEDTFVRDAAVIALGEIGTPDAVPFVCRSVLYRQPEAETGLVRISRGIILRRHGPPRLTWQVERGANSWIAQWDDARRRPSRPMVFTYQWFRLRELLDLFPDDETAALPIPSARSTESLPRPADGGSPAPQLLPYPA